MLIEVNAAPLHLEGQPALWLSGQPCLPQQVAGEFYNSQHVEAVVQGAGGQLGVPLVAWLSPEPENPHDGSAVMVWVRGGKVGYLPRADASNWQQVLFSLQRQARLPIACSAHIELPPQGGAEKGYQVVLWLPPLPWQTATPFAAQDIAMVMVRAQQEAAARAERWRLELEQMKANRAERMARLAARYGQDVAARIDAQELWVGATEEMVLEAFGAAAKVEEKVFKSKTKRVLAYTSECPRCDGTGVLTEFLHVNDGECFACHGTGRRKGFLRVRIENGVVVGWDKK